MPTIKNTTFSLPDNSLSQGRVWRFSRTHGKEEILDFTATEAPLEIKVRTANNPVFQNLAITMRTPGDDKELALGFLFSEGIIRDLSDLVSFEAQNNSVEIILRADLTHPALVATRHFIANSACGVCGKSDLDFLSQKPYFSPKKANFSVSPTIICHLPEVLRRHQTLFAETGGNHAAALFDAQGQLGALREDVGRHNAVDKLLGWAFLQNKMPLHQSILQVSGRASFELVQKAAMAGISIMAAVGAPSSLAVSAAQEHGLTLLGFVKNTGFNAYSWPERLLFEE